MASSPKSMRLIVGPCSKELQFDNRPVISDQDVKESKTMIKKYFMISSSTHKFTTKLNVNKSVPKGHIWCNKLIRISFSLMTDSLVKISEISPNEISEISKLNCTLEFLKEPNKSSINTEELNKAMLNEFSGECLNLGQSYVVKYQSMILSINISDITDSSANKLQFGIISSKSKAFFELGEENTMEPIELTGSNVIYRSDLIGSSLDFSSLGIGGLDKEVSQIFRRIFISRIAPEKVVKQMGVEHVKGFILFGPPGTGKTLIARQIAKILKSKPPKLVNGPDILDKYVGESEKKLRNLFADAEKDFKNLGSKSPLHVIIFDELDAICRPRGSSGAGSKVSDNIVNQLLTKIDGVDPIDNILVIGMTNRIDLIDEAIMRPGRLEVQLEISLPDYEGRIQILKIHTSILKSNNRLDKDVDLKSLARKTENFTGAEIKGLVGAAKSNSFAEYIKALSTVEINPEINNAVVSNRHFELALSHDIHPAFGTMNEDLKLAKSEGVILWNKEVEENLSRADMLINKAKKSKKVRLTTLLIAGDKKSGTTALAAHIAFQSKFKFTRMINPSSMADMAEYQCKQLIHSTFQDAYKTDSACIFIDDFESLIRYINIGPIYSNSILQILMSHLKASPPPKCNVLVIMTTSRLDIIDEIDLRSIFSEIIKTPKLTKVEEILFCLEELSPKLFNKCQSSIKSSNNLAGFSMGIKEFLEKIEICENIDESLQAIQMLKYLEMNSLPFIR